ncbi:MAG: DUF4093 domain-containing protein [Oscillospiraceae bacterium]|nr:DUF4093 domain-containing protein [Oscillospiraceae bacterium]
MNSRPKITPAIIVEGKYDKIRLESVVDAVIVVTGGFQIYHNTEQLALIRHYAETTGIVILTDADAAGFQIRGYLKGAVPNGTVYHVYIPGIHGKEHRKRLPSAEGLLGVEGIDRETLLNAFARAGVLDAAPRPRSNITPQLLYQLGLTGTPDCTARRRALLTALGLPPRLSVKGLCEVLSTMATETELPELLRSVLPKEAPS